MSRAAGGSPRQPRGPMPLISRRALLAGAGGSLALPALDRPAAAAPGRRPNIVCIPADDLGYADLSCYGRPDFATPHVDRLAGDGMRFLQAYANSAVCSATRTALITGRYQDRLAIGLEEPLASDVAGLPPGHPTLPSLLRAAGYRTALVGKWHLGFLPNYGPLKSGYDSYYGIRGGAADYLRHDGSLWDGDARAHEAGYLTDLFGDHAVRAIEDMARGPDPFLLSLHFTAPHWPWEAPEPDGEAESARIAAEPAPRLDDFDGGAQSVFAAMVTRMDLQVGRVLDALDRAGIAAETIVVFTSDNGGERVANAWPFTGRKTELLEGGLRIPAILRWPGRVAPGRTSDQVMISMDWLPTLAAAAGTGPDPAYPTDGLDLLSHLAPGAAAVPRALYWRYLSKRQKAVRDGDWKFLEILGNTFLFDVVADPMERANLKDRHRRSTRGSSASGTRGTAPCCPSRAASSRTPSRARIWPTTSARLPPSRARPSRRSDGRRGPLIQPSSPPRRRAGCRAGRGRAASRPRPRSRRGRDAR